MFEWLEKEIQFINTPKFHLIEGTLSPEKKKMVETSDLAVPPSYKEFVMKFGNIKLYRQGTIYLIQVFSVPIDTETGQGESLLNFGRTDRGLSYFKTSLLVEDAESPVFEWTGREAGLRQTANGFKEWLKKKCNSAKRQFSKKRWSEIVAGPKPFTLWEEAIVEARKRFHWRIIGIAEGGDLQFEVHNGSDMALPYLSIGIRGKQGRVQGGIWLSISHIAPGETEIVEKGCYKKLLAPEDVEAFQLPDPEPEDREKYWEFQGIKETK